MVGRTGFEPVTTAVSGQYPNQTRRPAHALVNQIGSIKLIFCSERTPEFMLGSGPSEVHMPYVFANKVPKDALR